MTKEKMVGESWKVIDTSKREFSESFRKGYELYKKGNLPKYTANLVLFYAVECGLKAILLSQQHVYMFSKLCKDYREYGHDIKKLLKHFGIESRFELKCFCTKLGQQVQPYQYHEVWRYGVEYDARDMEKIQKIENNLDEIAKWIEQNNGRHW